MTVNEEIRDDLITHEVRLQRTIAGEQRRAMTRQAELESKILGLLENNQMNTVLRRLRFFRQVSVLSREAYKEHSAESRSYLRGVARAESDAMITVIDDALQDAADGKLQQQD